MGKASVIELKMTTNDVFRKTQSQKINLYFWIKGNNIFEEYKPEKMFDM